MQQEESAQAQKEQSADRWTQLMVEAQMGNEQSYHTLLTEISKFLKPLLSHKMNSSAESEDVLQNVLITIHRSRHTFDPKYPFKPWLNTITRSRLIEFWRQRGRRKEYTAATDEFNFDQLQAEEEISQMAAEELQQALDKLNEKQQKILIGLKVEGQSIKEMAQKLGMSESAVKVAAHRAYKVVHESLRGEA